MNESFTKVSNSAYKRKYPIAKYFLREAVSGTDESLPPESFRRGTMHRTQAQPPNDPNMSVLMTNRT